MIRWGRATFLVTTILALGWSPRPATSYQATPHDLSLPPGVLAKSDPNPLPGILRSALQAIASGPFQLRCDDSWGLGAAWPTVRLIVVKNWVCRQAKAVVQDPTYGQGRPLYDRDLVLRVMAISILVHEAWHLSDNALATDEAFVACMELQSAPSLLRALGAPAEVAWKASKIARIVRLPLDEDTEYASPQCRRYGPWDLHPETASWPWP